MAKNNKIEVPYSHQRDAEKMIKQLKEILSNLELFQGSVDKLQQELNKPTEKMFKINED